MGSIYRDVSYKGYLGVTTPGDDTINRLTVGLQFVCREVPIRVADSDAYHYPLGLGYAGKLPHYFREHYTLVLYAGAESIAQCDKTDGLRDGTDVQ